MSNPIVAWSHAPCGLVCTCGARHIVAIDNTLTGAQRVKALCKSAAVLGWYLVEGEWRCGPCYGSAVLDAVMQQGAGVHVARAKVDRAADRRAELAAVEVFQ